MEQTAARAVGGAVTYSPAAQFRRYLLDTQALARDAGRTEPDPARRQTWQQIQLQLRAAQQAAQEL